MIEVNPHHQNDKYNNFDITKQASIYSMCMSQKYIAPVSNTTIINDTKIESVTQSTGCTNTEHIREVFGWNNNDLERTVEYLLMERAKRGIGCWNSTINKDTSTDAKDDQTKGNIENIDAEIVVSSSDILSNDIDAHQPPSTIVYSHQKNNNSPNEFVCTLRYKKDTLLNQFKSMKLDEIANKQNKSISQRYWFIEKCNNICDETQNNLQPNNVFKIGIIVDSKRMYLHASESGVVRLLDDSQVGSISYSNDYSTSSPKNTESRHVFTVTHNLSHSLFDGNFDCHGCYKCNLKTRLRLGASCNVCSKDFCRMCLAIFCPGYHGPVRLCSLSDVGDDVDYSFYCCVCHEMIDDKYCLKYGCEKCDFYVCGVCVVINQENTTYSYVDNAGIGFEQVKSAPIAENGFNFYFFEKDTVNDDSNINTNNINDNKNKCGCNCDRGWRFYFVQILCMLRVIMCWAPVFDMVTDICYGYIFKKVVNLHHLH